MELEEEDHLTRQHHALSASTFFAPSLSLLGPGAIHRLGPVMRESGLKKALIITDITYLREECRQVQRVIFSAGIDCSVFDEVDQNPTTHHVQAALLMAEEVAADCLVSVGGGSTHDTAKAVRALFGNEQQSEVDEIEGVDELMQTPILKHFAVSTTSGSSSELTRLAIITDPLNHVKMNVVDRRITPTVACNDTILMASQPSELIAASGVLALAHAVEAFLSTASTPVTDATSLHSIRLISTYLRRAVKSPDDLKACDMLTYAEFLAGLSFNSAGLGLTHAMSSQLGTLYPNVPLSQCSAVILPHVLQYYTEENVHNDDVAELFVDLAEALRCPAAACLSPAAAIPAVIHSVAQLTSDVELPGTLGELSARLGAGLRKDDIPEVAAKTLSDMGGITAPCKPKLGQVEDIFCCAWDANVISSASLPVSVDAVAKPTEEKSCRMRHDQLDGCSEYIDFNDAAALLEGIADTETE